MSSLLSRPLTVPARAEGSPPPPLGTAAAAITMLPLRTWDVEMGAMQKQLLEFGPAKKKSKAAAGGKSKKKK